MMHCLRRARERNPKALGSGLALPAGTTAAEADSSAT